MPLTWKELLKPAALTPRQQKERRGFLLSIAAGAGVVALALAGYVPVVAGWVKRLRPTSWVAHRPALPRRSPDVWRSIVR